MRKGYDPKCEELARYFLNAPSRPGAVEELAETIQGAVEDWLGSEAEWISAAKNEQPYCPVCHLQHIETCPFGAAQEAGC